MSPKVKITATSHDRLAECLITADLLLLSRPCSRGRRSGSWNSRRGLGRTRPLTRVSPTSSQGRVPVRSGRPRRSSALGRWNDTPHVAQLQDTASRGCAGSAPIPGFTGAIDGGTRGSRRRVLPTSRPDSRAREGGCL